ncbi:hypothetical protein T310_8132 [Rasamsonia emersonii CBS 393.64]|uniref:Uncharacterized protein n=1 Tax=Rasamsonia emersonii (strain ATCC 16479 / CBS 393.64 / IMI 116815) TaxID=1408163 RepID=A0A0F4YJ68_RASE3|nr:hypothetical protein T310_8132 [Rasamsonia emersonii CBS 393.64]KKA17921.1 hypothetical protein T310_8132 [Rasamsonia emersonii CBS 393.64]
MRLWHWRVSWSATPTHTLYGYSLRNYIDGLPVLTSDLSASEFVTAPKDTRDCWTLTSLKQLQAMEEQDGAPIHVERGLEVWGKNTCMVDWSCLKFCKPVLAQIVTKVTRVTRVTKVMKVLNDTTDGLEEKSRDIACCNSAQTHEKKQHVSIRQAVNILPRKTHFTISVYSSSTRKGISRCRSANNPQVTDDVVDKPDIFNEMPPVPAPATVGAPTPRSAPVTTILRMMRTQRRYKRRANMPDEILDLVEGPSTIDASIDEEYDVSTESHVLRQFEKNARKRLHEAACAIRDELDIFQTVYRRTTGRNVNLVSATPVHSEDPIQTSVPEFDPLYDASDVEEGEIAPTTAAVSDMDIDIYGNTPLGGISPVSLHSSHRYCLVCGLRKNQGRSEAAVVPEELNHNLGAFSGYLVYNFFLPLKASSRRTPQPTPTSLSRGQTSKLVCAPQWLSTLQYDYLICDCYQCVISQKFDWNEAEVRMTRDGNNACDDDGQLLTHEPQTLASLEVTHILLPFLSCPSPLVILSWFVYHIRAIAVDGTTLSGTVTAPVSNRPIHPEKTVPVSIENDARWWLTEDASRASYPSHACRLNWSPVNVDDRLYALAPEKSREFSAKEKRHFRSTVSITGIEERRYEEHHIFHYQEYVNKHHK